MWNKLFTVVVEVNNYVKAAKGEKAENSIFKGGFTFSIQQMWKLSEWQHENYCVYVCGWKVVKHVKPSILSKLDKFSARKT